MDVSSLPVMREADGVFGARRADVDEFFARMRSAQAEYLEAVAVAGMLLRSDGGRLEEVAAAHARLTHEFLDAERALLRRRTDADLQVAKILSTAEADAAALVQDALAQAGPLPAGLATFTVSANEPAHLEYPGEQVGAEARAELRALLDEWWHRENLAAEQAVEAANVHAAMRVRLAGIEAGEILAAASGTDPVDERVAPYQPPALLPEALLAALDAADHDQLDVLFAELISSLADVPAAAPLGSPLPGEPRPPVLPLPPVELFAPGLSSEPALEQNFADFWASAPEEMQEPSLLRNVLLHAVLPVTVIVGLLTALMVWIG